MRAAQALSGLFVLGLMIYVVSNFAAVQSALGPMGKLEKEEPAKPLNEAAPEVATLRAGMRDLAAEALKAVPLCINRDEREDLARPRGRVLVWDAQENDVSEAHGRLRAE